MVNFGPGDVNPFGNLSAASHWVVELAKYLIIDDLVDIEIVYLGRQPVRETLRGSLLLN
jgi:hypothetical protein